MGIRSRRSSLVIAGHRERTRGHRRAGWQSLLFWINQRIFLFLPFRQSARTNCLETVSFENVRGTRGSGTAISSRDDELILRYFREPVLELPQWDVDIAFDRAQLFQFLGLAHV